MNLSRIASAVGAIAVLAFVILVHESGHYLTARALGIRVEEFGIGFGPKLLGWTAFGNDFSLRALPLGGYVRFPKHYVTTKAQLAELAKWLEDADNETPSQPEHNNDNLRFETDQDVMRRKQERLQKVLDASPLWKKLGPKLKTHTEIEYYDDPDLFQNRPWPERAIVTAGGVIFNLLLAFCIYFGQITVGSGLPKPVLEPGLRVDATPTGNAAAVGLLQEGDVILKINGTPLAATSKPLTVQMWQKAINDFGVIIQATPEGEAVHLQVLKASSDTTNMKHIADLAIRPKSNGKVKFIGVTLGPNIRRTDTIRSDSAGEACKIAGSAVKEMTYETVLDFSELVSAMIPGKGGGSAWIVSGPIGMIQMGSEVG